MSKKDLILDAYEELLTAGNEEVSIQDIADKLGIAKGGLYYYFKDKDQLLDEVVERYYSSIIDSAYLGAEKEERSINRIIVFFSNYLGNIRKDYLEKSLHKPKNAYIHQKSLKYICLRISEILAGFIESGIEKGEFTCDKPLESSQILVSSMAFLLDRGIFTWSEEEYYSRLILVVSILEDIIGLEKGTLSDLRKFYL